MKSDLKVGKVKGQVLRESVKRVKNKIGRKGAETETEKKSHLLNKRNNSENWKIKNIWKISKQES